MYADAAKIKQIRMRILENLNMMYPSGMQLNCLFRTVLPFDSTYSKQLFEKDLTYLHEKGYVEFIDNQIGGFDSFFKKVAKLTVEGKEITEGTGSDKALEI